MKAILIIDVGKSIDFKKDFAKIRLFTSNGRGISYYNKVKLQPIPQKKILDEELFMLGNFRLIQARFTGWNDCIDEILGDTE